MRALIAVAIAFIATPVIAADLEGLAREGYGVVKETRVDGEVEGCDFDKRIPFTNEGGHEDGGNTDPTTPRFGQMVCGHCLDTIHHLGYLIFRESLRHFRMTTDTIHHLCNETLINRPR